jgi:hypothetical protein
LPPQPETAEVGRTLLYVGLGYLALIRTRWVGWLRKLYSDLGLSQKPPIDGVMLLKLGHVVRDCMPWRLLSNEDMPQWARLRLAIQHPCVQHDEVGPLQRNRQWRAADTTKRVPVWGWFPEQRRLVYRKEVFAANPSELGCQRRKLGCES